MLPGLGVGHRELRRLAAAKLLAHLARCFIINSSINLEIYRLQLEVQGVHHQLRSASRRHATAREVAGAVVRPDREVAHRPVHGQGSAAVEPGNPRPAPKIKSIISRLEGAAF